MGDGLQVVINCWFSWCRRYRPKVSRGAPDFVLILIVTSHAGYHYLASFSKFFGDNLIRIGHGPKRYCPKIKLPVRLLSEKITAFCTLLRAISLLSTLVVISPRNRAFSGFRRICGMNSIVGNRIDIVHPYGGNGIWSVMKKYAVTAL